MPTSTDAGLRSEARTVLGNLANRVGVDFLQLDSEIALTFSGIALEAREQEKRTRTTQIARRAYDTIMQLRKDIELSDAEGDKLDSNLQRLKSKLQRLGQSI